ncbi:hypothetical protein AR437_10320 [Christensenella hongkongensis]|nr:hypothetical protein AR437_10320 [Christensenella hongkongensis]
MRVTQLTQIALTCIFYTFILKSGKRNLEILRSALHTGKRLAGRECMMKVTLDIDPKYEQDEIIIRCAEMSDELLKLVALAGTSQKKVMGNLEKQTFVLEPEEIYYFESVDDRVYIYTKTEVYDCPLKLYEIEEKFGNGSFLRVNKSTIINLSKVRVLNPILNGKIEVELENGEKQIISRQYAPALKEKLGIRR